MSVEFTIEMMEQKKDHLFVTGIVLSDIASDTTFTELYQAGSHQKSRKKLETIELKVESIIVDGGSVEAAAADSAAMLLLSGDFSAVQSQAQALGWRKKSGRLLRTSDIALILTAPDA